MAQTCELDWASSTGHPRHLDFRQYDIAGNIRQTYRVLLEKGQDGWIVARSLDIRGAVSQGKNQDEALRNIVEAISLILEDIAASSGKEMEEFSITWEQKEEQ